MLDQATNAITGNSARPSQPLVAHCPFLLACFCWLSLLVTPLSAQSKSASLLRQHRTQQQAREMAAELVSGVLDIQLRQLAENQLEQLPIYAEIKSMRGNLDRLVARDMQDVVALLAQSQAAGDREQARLLQQARDKIRSVVVVTLTAERHKLSKRLQLAKLTAQIQPLIQLETKVLNRTRLLAEEALPSRERATLDALEDHRDAAALHFQFVDVLADVATWDGPVGAGASKGIRLLKTLQIEVELLRAERSLRDSQIEAAEQSAAAAIRGWRALRAVLEETQGLAGADQESLTKRVAALIKRQEQLREETKATDAQHQQRTEQLAQQQHDLQNDLRQLAEALREFANTESLAERAKAAAFEAESKLFEGALLEATLQQGQVIGALAEIKSRLEQAAQSSSNKTADQLADEVRQLERLDLALDQVRLQQTEVTKQSSQDAAAANVAEEQVARRLTAANALEDFGTALESRLVDAEEQVTLAQQTLSTAAPDMAERRVEAVGRATQAIDRAVAEVKQELMNSRREQFAVTVGELARAAEALERAAAAEREIGDAARTAAAADGLSASEARALVTEQTHVGEVASSIAEGVRHTAPPAAQRLDAAQPQLLEVGTQLLAAQQTPGAVAKPASQQAAKLAQLAAIELEQAAKQLRERAGLAATELAQLAAQQLQPTVAARQAVEQAVTTAENQLSGARLAAALQRALAETRAAQWDQLRAAGQPLAADLQQRLQSLQLAVQQQKAADAAALEFARGRSNSSLKAAQAEERVGDLVAELARRSDGAVQRELQSIASAAEEAARELLVGNPNTAAAARRVAIEALHRVLEVTQNDGANAAQLPASGTDALAQARVSQRVEEARRAAGDAAPAAQASLGEARMQSEAASKALAAQNARAAAEPQARATAALAESVAQLQQALEAATQNQLQQATEFAQQAAELAGQTMPVDSGAAVALEQAGKAATDAIKVPIAAEDAARVPSSEVTRGLERATASLASREQDLRRDQEIASDIARLARMQQGARDQIAEQSAKLQQLAKPPPPPGTAPPAPSPEELAAAQSLADAADQFAEAQRATGEGAAEISGQEEVANQPIRRGLETASQLGRSLAAQAADPAAETPPDNQPAQELGTDFVPRSPDETARRIAGKETFEEAAKALAQQQRTSAEPLSGDAAKKSQPQTSENSPRPTDSQPTEAEKTQAARKGEAAMAADQQGQNEKLDASQLEQESNAKERDSRANSGNNSEEPPVRTFQAEAWFAKLPPGLQRAIQSKTRRSAPRGYEERLKRYFESTD